MADASEVPRALRITARGFDQVRTNPEIPAKSLKQRAAFPASLGGNPGAVGGCRNSLPGPSQVLRSGPPNTANATLLRKPHHSDRRTSELARAALEVMRRPAPTGMAPLSCMPESCGHLVAVDAGRCRPTASPGGALVGDAHPERVAAPRCGGPAVPNRRAMRRLKSMANRLCAANKE